MSEALKNFEQARKAFKACQALVAGANPGERRHWLRMEAIWAAKMDEARRDLERER